LRGCGKGVDVQRDWFARAQALDDRERRLHSSENFTERDGGFSAFANGLRKSLPFGDVSFILPQG
jgi:hypothetical protein